jgi:hypothetical protein
VTRYEELYGIGEPDVNLEKATEMEPRYSGGKPGKRKQE